VSDAWRSPLVVSTREEGGDDGFARVLQAAGVRVIAMPTIAVGPPEDPEPLAEALEHLAATRWVVFTSAHAVAATCGHPVWAGAWGALRTRPRIAAVGPGTAARLSALGLPCDLVPDQPGGRELAAALVRCDASLSGARVLWPRSNLARPDVYAVLTAAGAEVRDPEAYRTALVRPRGLAAFTAKLDAAGIDAVAFFSPSAAEGLAAALPGGTLRRLAGRTHVASIGPSTSAAVDALGAPATIEADPRTAAGLATAIVRRVARSEGAA
jgi:uroporphyrinogen III methyltransferase/synthase